MTSIITPSPAAAAGSAALEEKVKAAIMEELLKHGKAATTVTTGTTKIEEPVPAAPPIPIVVLKSGQKTAFDIVGPGSVLPELDFAVTIFQPTDWHEKVRAFIPEIDPTFQPDPGHVVTLLRALEVGDTTLITGPTGSGKSQLVRHVAALTGRPLIRINMTEDMESSMVFGYTTVRSGTMEWEDGPATEAALYGAILNVDEWDVTPPGVFMGFQWMLENDGKLFLKEKPGKSEDKIVTPHKQFRLVMNGNTVGQGDDTGKYAGTTPQNTAAIDRFMTTLQIQYLTPTAEEKVLKHVLGDLPKAYINKMVKMAGLIRTAYSQNTIGLTMSPRTLINWGKKSLVYRDALAALEVAYLNKLRDSERNLARESFNKVFGSNTKVF